MNGKRKIYAERSRSIRLQKFLSQAGVSSRRQAEKMILAGRVSLNGQRVTEMGVLVAPEVDRIQVDGKDIRNKPQHVYYIFHKPKNVMVTRHDPEGRPTIYDYLKEIPERVNYVGRLDFDSEGLILLTNDGELHYRMTHPSQEIPKTYRVKYLPILVSHRRVLSAGSPLSCVTNGLKGQTGCHPPEQGRKSADIPLQGAIKKLSGGIDIGGYVTAPCKVRLTSPPSLPLSLIRRGGGGERSDDAYWLELTITEGKNRQVRRMCEAVGIQVIRLIRVTIGPLQLGDLPAGRYRPLTTQEIKRLESFDIGQKS